MPKKEIKRLTAKQAIALSERDTQAREVSKVLGKVDMIIRLVATAQTYLPTSDDLNQANKNGCATYLPKHGRSSLRQCAALQHGCIRFNCR